MGFRPLTAEQWHSSLRTAIAGLVAAPIALNWGGNSGLDVWYCLYGVARSNLADQRLSGRAATEQLLGTLVGGGIGAGLVILGSNGLLVGVAYLLVELIGNRWGLSQGSRTNAIIAAILLLMVPEYGKEGAHWVANRLGWYLLGLAIGMAVERLLWPRGDRQRLAEQERNLIENLQTLRQEQAQEPPAGGRTGEPMDQERRLVNGFRQVRDLAQLVATADPDGWSRHGGEKRLRGLEQAVFHAAALLRHPSGIETAGPLTRRCAELDLNALVWELDQLAASA